MVHEKLGLTGKGIKVGIIGKRKQGSNVAPGKVD